MDAKKRLDKAQRRFRSEIEAIAHDVRISLVVPACKQHHMSFVSDADRYFFAKGNVQIRNAQQAQEAGYPDLMPVFPTLDMPVFNSFDLLGCHVRAVHWRRGEFVQ